jgi:hypothetical protein
MLAALSSGSHSKQVLVSKPGFLGAHELERVCQALPELFFLLER